MNWNLVHVTYDEGVLREIEVGWRLMTIAFSTIVQHIMIAFPISH